MNELLTQLNRFFLPEQGRFFFTTERDILLRSIGQKNIFQKVIFWHKKELLLQHNKK